MKGGAWRSGRQLPPSHLGLPAVAWLAPPHEPIFSWLIKFPHGLNLFLNTPEPTPKP